VGTARTVVVATDGYVSVEPEAFDLIRSNLGQANVFAFGIGSSVNRFLIEGMARAGAGEPFVVTDPAEAEVIAARFQRYIQTPVLPQVSLNTGDFAVYDVEPLSVPDVLAQRPVLIFGKWRGTAAGRIHLQGMTGNNESYALDMDVAEAQPEATNRALRYLWARQKIVQLGDYNQLRNDPQRVEEITRLGLEYNLLTAYTSFVAVDKVVRADGTETVTVRQPLPLPQDVEDGAVGSFGATAVMGSGGVTSAPLGTSGQMLDLHPVKPLAPALMQNAPNPFNAETTIRLVIPAGFGKQMVSLAIYNQAGQKVRVLAEKVLGTGEFEFVWDGKDEAGKEVASGVYIYRLEIGAYKTERRMALVR
jgi:hypothetical protein